MPIYEYNCEKCGTIEVIQSASEAPLKHCPECVAKGKKNKVARLVSPAAFHLKGSGWYKTDYSAKSNGSGPSKSEKSKSENAASSSDSAPGKTADSQNGSAASNESKPAAQGKKSGGGGCGSSCACD